MSKFELPAASSIRKDILTMSFVGQSVHVPSAFSIVEILRVLHESVLEYPNNDPDSPDRDYLVLSKGHGAMALYAILLARGWISRESLSGYFSDGSLLPGLTEASVPGCEANTGSLGQGINVAVGLALGAKLRFSNQRAFCIIGDGELNEGSVYEALSFSAHKGLDNLTIVIDLNGYQAMGSTRDVLGSMDLDKFLSSLGFNVLRISGHDESAIKGAFQKNHSSIQPGKPTAVIAETVKGKGVSFMEDANEWHYLRLSDAQFNLALDELSA